jgi:acyl-CoA thioester hydrolase
VLVTDRLPRAPAYDCIFGARVLNGLRHVERLRVAWVDTDAGGRIHFTAAFRYAELAETSLMRELGLVDELVDYPRRRVEADFRAVLRFEDEVEVTIRPERIGTTSITWAWEIARDGEVCVEGRHTVVHVGPDGRPAPLPDKVRERLAARYQGRASSSA